MINKRPIPAENAEIEEPQDLPKKESMISMVEKLPMESSAIDSMRRENDPRTGFRKSPPAPTYNPPPESENDVPPEEDMPQEAACDASFFDKLQRFLMPLLLLAVALLGCSITKNIAVFYQTVRTMALWEIILFSIPMAVFSGILLFVLYKLIVLMGHLRAFTQISGKLVELLKEDSKDQDKLFMACGGNKLMEIRAAKESLLGYHCTDREWISKYVDEYQNKVDSLAKDIIGRYSWKAAAAATASPFVALDQIIVLATCVTMLKDLFLLYNLRPTWDKNLLLMARMVIHVYATGFWQDFSKAGVEALDKGLDTFIDNVKNSPMEGFMAKAGSSVGGLLGGNLGNIVARGVGECVMHKITVGRLGAAAIRMLQPVGK